MNWTTEASGFLSLALKLPYRRPRTVKLEVFSHKICTSLVCCVTVSVLSRRLRVANCLYAWPGNIFTCSTYKNFLRVKNTFFSRIHRRRNRSRNLAHEQRSTLTPRRRKYNEPMWRKFIAHHLCNFPHRRRHRRITRTIIIIRNEINWLNWKFKHQNRQKILWGEREIHWEKIREKRVYITRAISASTIFSDRNYKSTDIRAHRDRCSCENEI